MSKKILVLILIILILGGGFYFWNQDNHSEIKKEKEPEIVIETIDILGDKEKEEFLEMRRKADAEYLKNRLEEVKKMGIEFIDTEDINGEKVKETVWVEKWVPIKEVNLNARAIWENEFLGKKKEEIMREYKGFVESDFKNTGELRGQLDVDILLNNVLERTGLQPINEEHIEALVKDIKNGEF